MRDEACNYQESAMAYNSMENKQGSTINEAAKM